MISVQAPWSAQEVLLIEPSANGAIIPVLGGKTIEVQTLAFVKHIRVAGKLMDMDSAKALISALMAQVTYLEAIP